MRILIVAATEFEVDVLKMEAKNHSHQVDFLITGVGMVATAFALAKHLATNTYQLVINLGIAGSFNRNIKLGEVVEVIEDCFSELGAEDDDAFLTIDALGFGKSTFTPTARLVEFGEFNLTQATAITVNTVHGNMQSIEKLNNSLQPDLESMEGAAVFYTCQQMGLTCLQIRAVSNYVEKRNRDAWQIGLAIKNLNNFGIGLLNSLKGL